MPSYNIKVTARAKVAMETTILVEDVESLEEAKADALEQAKQRDGSCDWKIMFWEDSDIQLDTIAVSKDEDDHEELDEEEDDGDR